MLSIGTMFLAAAAFFAAAKIPPITDARLDAPKWPTVVPEYYRSEKDPACRMTGTYFAGGFVSAVDDHGKGRFYLRRRFGLKSVPERAWLQGMADYAAVFRINGHETARSSYSYMTTSNRSVNREISSQLKAGDNELLVEYELNDEFEYHIPRTYAGGAMAEIAVRYPDGTYEKIDLDGSSESSKDGRNWHGVVVSEPPPKPPRYTRYRYVDYTNPQKVVKQAESREIAAGGRSVYEFEIAGTPPSGGFNVRIRWRRDGHVSFGEEVEVPASAVKRLGDRWRLALELEAPLYVRGGDYRLTVESNSIYMPRGELATTVTIEEAKTIPGFENGVNAEIKTVGGCPQIHIDGRPFAMLWGGVQQDRRPDGRPFHGGMPLNAVTVHSNYAIWHPEMGNYDFSVFDSQAEKYRRSNPGAYFIWDLSVYPPPDFKAKFPGEMASDETGDIESVGRFSWSWASERGLAEIREMIAKAVEYLETSPYANRIIGYRVNSGVTIEWLGWDAKPGHAKDFSEPNRKAFEKFAAEKYPEIMYPHVPRLEERRDLDSRHDILWDRGKHLNSIAYMDFNSKIICRDLLEACGVAKSTLARFGKRKLVGTYYGYTFYLNCGGTGVRRGHFALEDLLERNDGCIDFLMSPPAYNPRGLGDASVDMKPFATLQRHGIMPVCEDDTRTHNRMWPLWYAFDQSVTARQTESLLRRNGSAAICRGSAPYFYALATGLDFSGDECTKVGDDLLATERFAIAANARRRSEVALVMSEKSEVSLPEYGRRDWSGDWVQKYLFDGSATVEAEMTAVYHGQIHQSLLNRFARSGAPYDQLLAEDLKHNPGDYKLYVFLDMFCYDESTLAAIDGIRKRGATILWLYAPGYMRSNSLADMRRLTGIGFGQEANWNRPIAVTMKDDGRGMGMPEGVKTARMFYPLDADEVLGVYADGRPGVVMKKVGRSKAFFSGPWQIDLKFIRSVEASAGVFRYCETDDPIEANDALFTLHARSPGKRKVTFPKKVTKVYDVFNRCYLKVDAKSNSVVLDAELHDTFLLRIR